VALGLCCRGTFWGEHGWFRIERGVNALLVEGACTAATPTYDGLEEELRGAESGGMLGLEAIPRAKQWSHLPTRAHTPPSLREVDSAVVMLAAQDAASSSVASAQHAHALLPTGALACAFAIALAVSAFAAGVAVTRRRLRLEQLGRGRSDRGHEPDGLRAPILRDAA
jgi:hypothetical protein